MNGKTKSIILQVAFKEAATPDGDITAIAARTAEFYDMLLALHTSLGIEPDEAPVRRNRTRTTGTGTGSNVGSTIPDGETFIIEGVLYTDFREGKAAPGVNPNFPDFKRESDNQGFWMYDRDGSPNEDVKELVTAADTKVF